MTQVRKDVLNGWKEIAAYLGRDSRTVERWEKQRSLPVRRLPGSGRATVYALVSELDAWLASTPPREAETIMPAPLLPGALLPDAAQEPLAAAAVLPLQEVLGAQAIAPTAGGGAQGTGTGFGSFSRKWLLALAAAVVFGLATGWSLLHHRHEVGALPLEEATRVGHSRPHTLVPSSGVPGVEQLYMRGCYQTEQRTPESLHRAQEAFSTALAKDPAYAPAMAGLGITYLLLREYATLPDAQAYREARKAAQAALARDPDLPQGHAVLGFVLFFGDWKPVEAEAEFHIALRLDPDLALSHHWYGSMLTHEGRFNEGLRELETAQRLEPSSAAILTIRALALGLSGHRNDSTDLLQEAVSADGGGHYRNPATMHSVLGLLSLLPPRDLPRYLSETMVAAEVRQDTRGVETMHMATEVYQQRGEAAMWQALLQDEQKQHAGGSPTYAMARFETETGARELALKHLAELYERHDPALIGLAIDPLLTPLQGEPRFGQLRSAMGLPTVAPR